MNIYLNKQVNKIVKSNNSLKNQSKTSYFVNKTIIPNEIELIAYVIEKNKYQNKFYLKYELLGIASNIKNKNNLFNNLMETILISNLCLIEVDETFYTQTKIFKRIKLKYSFNSKFTKILQIKY